MDQSVFANVAISAINPLPLSIYRLILFFYRNTLVHQDSEHGPTTARRQWRVNLQSTPKGAGCAAPPAEACEVRSDAAQADLLAGEMGQLSSRD